MKSVSTVIAVQPEKLTVRKDRRSLEIAFQGVSFELSSELLRVLSPSAEVQGHSPDQKKTVAGKRDVEILKVEPVGNYAVRISFDDMHDTGIFTWEYLRKLGENKDDKWQAYLDELKEKQLSREPAAPSRIIP